MLHVNKCARVLMKNGLDRLVHMKTYCCPKWWKEFTVEILMTCTEYSYTQNKFLNFAMKVVSLIYFSANFFKIFIVNLHSGVWRAADCTVNTVQIK